LRCYSVSLLLDDCGHLALQEGAVAADDLGLVESLVLGHLALHQVLHYAGVEVLAVALAGLVDFFRVVSEGFWALSLLKWLVAATCDSVGATKSTHLGLVRASLSAACVVVVAVRVAVLRDVGPLIILRLASGRLSPSCLLLYLFEHRHFVDQNNSSQFCRILQSLELSI